MKKTLFFVFAAILALGLGSCLKDGLKNSEGTVDLVIKMGVKEVPDTRAIDNPATNAKADIDIIKAQSLIFVADGNGAIIQTVEIDKTDATDSDGQELPIAVPIGSSVYIVANIPTADLAAVKLLTTLSAVKAFVSEISTQSGVSFTTPALANVGGAAVVVDNTGITAGKKTITIHIEPLIARLEVVAMQAIEDASGNTIKSFDVTGVYVGEFYPDFNYTDGQTTSAVVSKKAAIEAAADNSALATIYSGWETYMKDEQTWSSTGKLLNGPEAGKVWAFNVVAKGKPHIIFRIANIVYENAAGSEVTISEPRYITVEGYTGVTEFGRGEVYRIGKVTSGDSNFQFDFSHLNQNPYEEAVGLNVIVDIVPWNVTDYTPIIRP